MDFNPGFVVRPTSLAASFGQTPFDHPGSVYALSLTHTLTTRSDFRIAKGRFEDTDNTGIQPPSLARGLAYNMAVTA
jgi:hypothetical protein